MGSTKMPFVQANANLQDSNRRFMSFKVNTNAQFDICELYANYEAFAFPLNSSDAQLYLSDCYL